MTTWVQARSADQAADDALELFRSHFGEEPSGVWCAPGRVNLIGEHVDYAGGICLPFALEHATYLAARAREDSLVRLVSEFHGRAQVGQVDLREVGPGNPSSWEGYVVGPLWALGLTQGFDFAIVSDVPVGAGLSSSAALECSAAVAAVELAGADATPEDIVQVAIRAENEVVGASTGGLDQTVAMFGQQGHALAIDFLDWTHNSVPFDLKEHNLGLLIVDTNAPHQLADGQYASRRTIADQVAHTAGQEVLRSVQDPRQAAEEFAAASGRDVEEVQRRVRHIVSEIERTQQAIKDLKHDDFEAFGQAMFASHASLRDDYEVTVAELDLVVSTAEHHGAVGARMTGGGFGGSAIVLANAERIPEIAQSIDAAFAEAGFNAPGFAQSRASAGARRVR
ncbi:galactokinase [Corynebacterium tapiri]|uniref:Galactokinase n=1 Tax=Corynebacterium tapiri TaxID=1448266 RepID=A0A5C4U730_9CORY|nr:galactokinase [Corynebacterium tapiri]TNL99787.1 galactokinase [Corynebacterium tapiri]